MNSVSVNLAQSARRKAIGQPEARIIYSSPRAIEARSLLALSHEHGAAMVSVSTAGSAGRRAAMSFFDLITNVGKFARKRLRKKYSPYTPRRKHYTPPKKIIDATILVQPGVVVPMRNAAIAWINMSVPITRAHTPT